MYRLAMHSGRWPSILLKRRMYPFLYLAPALVVLVVVAVVPIAFECYMSMLDFNIGDLWEFRRFTGLDNFRCLFGGEDPEFYLSVLRTVVFATVVTAVSLVAGMCIAILFNRPLRAENVLTGALIAPIALSPPIVGLMWKLMYNTEYGIFNAVLRGFGIEVLWLGREWAFASVAIVSIWGGTAFMAVVLLSGLKSLPVEPYEAAKIDGATGAQTLLYVTIPMLRPIILVAAVLQQISALHVFGSVLILTQGGPGSRTTLLGLHVYRTGLVMTWAGRAAAIAIVLAGIALLAVFVLSRLVPETDEGSRG